MVLNMVKGYKYICRQCNQDVTKHEHKDGKYFYVCVLCGFVSFECVTRKKKE